MSHKITFYRSDEEHLDISVDGKMVASYSYDDHGWAGMASAEHMLVRIAKMLNIEIEKIEGASDDE